MQPQIYNLGFAECVQAASLAQKRRQQGGGHPEKPNLWQGGTLHHVYLALRGFSFGFTFQSRERSAMGARMPFEPGVGILL